MDKLKRIIFLHSIFTEKYVKKSKAISPASNLWLKNFASNLKDKKIRVLCAGIDYNQAWPIGKLIINSSKKNYLRNFASRTFNYINLPYLKYIHLYLIYLNYLLHFPFKNGDLVVIYNKSFLAKVLYILNLVKRIPWICIVADLNYPKNANGYVYLSWNYFKKIKEKQKKLFLDGGIYKFNIPREKVKIKQKKKIILYSGSIGDNNSGMGYTGLHTLLKAFSRLKNKNVHLWIFGKGKSHQLEEYIKKDKRIKFYGFVNKKKLIYLCQTADIFINPRPSEINKYNFPSKVLFYLNFNKPIISNKIGLHSKYRNILFILKNEKVNTLTREIEKILYIDKKNLKTLKTKIINFKAQNTWSFHVKRFINWINNQGFYKHY
jgi:hypothetical protein